MPCAVSANGKPKRSRRIATTPLLLVKQLGLMFPQPMQKPSGCFRAGLARHLPYNGGAWRWSSLRLENEHRQWLRLPIAERRAERDLTKDLASYLQAQTTRKSETELIASQLAARSGLERVWSVDDQSFVGAPVDDKAYGAAIERAWDNTATKARAAADAELYARAVQPDGLLSLYRAFNAPAFAAQKYQSDWGPALTEPSADAYGRRYVAYWETRNLRMVANIREVLGLAPGTRLVAIVGASHKGYYEAYLRQMRDVTLANVKPVLR